MGLSDEWVVCPACHGDKPDDCETCWARDAMRCYLEERPEGGDRMSPCLDMPLDRRDAVNAQLLMLAA